MKFFARIDGFEVAAIDRVSTKRPNPSNKGRVLGLEWLKQISKMTFLEVNHSRFRGALSKICAGNSARSAANIADPELSSLLGRV